MCGLGCSIRLTWLVFGGLFYLGAMYWKEETENRLRPLPGPTVYLLSYPYALFGKEHAEHGFAGI